MRVAVVTGANKGIGFAIVKLLAKIFDGDVLLTARNGDLGLKACQEIANQGINNVKFHQLDIDNQESIHRFAEFIKQTYNGLDVLINNAAILYKAINTIRVNFTSTLNLCKVLFPLLRPHARVVNVSSRLGMLSMINDPKIRERLKSDHLTVDELEIIMEEFVKLSQIGQHEKISNSAYGMSKAGLIALTRIQQREFLTDPRPDLIVNSMTPGYVKTDMTENKGILTPDQGADTVIFLATIPPNAVGPKGEFLGERSPIDWTDPNFKL